MRSAPEAKVRVSEAEADLAAGMKIRDPDGSVRDTLLCLIMLRRTGAIAPGAATGTAARIG